MTSSSEAFTTLVTTDAVARHLSDPDWAIVDCRFELSQPAWGEAAYRAGHVPGAVYAHLDRDLSGRPGPRTGRHPLPDPAALKVALGRWGIDARAQVIVYDQDAGLYASRLWWMLKTFGHDRVALLDGGFAGWTAEGRAVRAGDEQRTPRLFTGAFHADRYVTSEEVGRLARDPRYRVIDVRAPERYRGDEEPIDPVAGHVPGAANRFARVNLSSDGTMRPAGELREEFRALLGDVPSARAVFYCGSGVFSCHSLLALAHAGLEPGRLYAGSWSEWCRQPERPVATGDENQGTGSQESGARESG